MSYIVFDLEWNQPVNKSKNSNKKIGKTKIDFKNFFEIIEIGAVKLDENNNIISEFNQIVKPQIFKKLNWHTMKMLHIKEADLNKGKPFPEVMEKFLEWCGENPIFLSWGSQDLTELQQNMSYYNMTPLADGPIAYYDVQKIFGKFIGDEETSKKLEDAIDFLKIGKVIPFHRAYSDAYYTAKVFHEIDEKYTKDAKVFNTYYLPKNKSKEICLRQGDEYIYISQGYKERSAISESRRMLAFNCPECLYKPIRPKVRWFSTNSKIYYGAAICKEHGPIKGKLKIRKHNSGLYFVEKYLIYANDDEIEEIKNRKNAVKKKTSIKEDTEKIKEFEKKED